MENKKLAKIESHFADIIWSHEPLSTAQLIKLCEHELSWKRTTTYTVLKRLCDRGIFTLVNGTITSLVTHDEFYSMQSEEIIDNNFEGSLPKFIAAFAAKNKLSEKDISEIQAMIDKFKREE